MSGNGEKIISSPVSRCRESVRGAWNETGVFIRGFDIRQLPLNIDNIQVRSTWNSNSLARKVVLGVFVGRILRLLSGAAIVADGAARASGSKSGAETHDAVPTARDLSTGES